MTATAERLVLKLPRPLPHQRPVLDDPSSRKVWRAGRRTGKSVAGRVAAIRGHGPKGRDGKRTLRGMLDGANVAWVTKTYKQSKVVWRKLLRTFRPLEGTLVTIDREDRRIAMVGNTGAITVWSGHTRDAIDNLRGDDFDGVLLDEAAYIDLEYALKDVLQPTLLDRGGWLFIFSSPNAGWDKNELRVTPSYFNRLCQEILDGKRPSWRQWHNRTDDNPRVNREALAELRAEYGPDSATAQQELDALLVVGGLMALIFDADALLDAPKPVARHWKLWGAVDWGYSHPWVFGLFAANESGIVRLIDSVKDRKDEPAQIAEKVAELLQRYGLTYADLAFTTAGGDVFDEHGKARGLEGPPIAEQWRGLGWTVIRSAASGSGHRVPSLQNLRQLLADPVSFRVYDTPGNRSVLRCCSTRISDPKHPEDVLKQDADGGGRGGDDEYDMLRYGAYARVQTPDAPPKPKREGVAQTVARYLERTEQPKGPSIGRRVAVTSYARR